MGSYWGCHMRNCAAVLISIALWSHALLGQAVRIPFVGCESFGQAEVIEAPRGNNRILQLKASVSQKLAYYQSSVAPGVLAPLGWHCVGLYGSSGGDLLVAPQPLDRGDVFLQNGEITGPAVEVSEIGGGTSGRFEVAHVLARVFPAHTAFVQDLIDSFDFSPSEFKFGPFPNDKLLVQKDQFVEFRTPPHSEGLGSIDTRLKANDDPIDGVAILEGQTPDLLMLRVRLPRGQRELAAVIIRELLFRQRRDAR